MSGLRYLGYSVVFQEVPDEITLAINITGCPYKCNGCHSQYLWEDRGRYINTDLNAIISQHVEYITCVCIMGGDQNLQELIDIFKYIQNTYHLKTCLYSGNRDVHYFDNVLPYLDYIKIGPYIQSKGGLDSETTNQRMYKVQHSQIVDDITYKFLKQYRRQQVEN